MLLGTKRAWVVHGADGIDELTTTGYTKISECRDGAVNTFYLHPADVGLPKKAKPSPAAVKFSSGSPVASAVAAGHNHSCALLSSSLACWGQAGFGQLGDGSTSDRDQARQVSLSNPTAIAAGRAHSCAVGGGAQDVWCWGANDSGQLGTGDNVAQPLPFEILLSQVNSLSSGADHVCALQSSGAILCWGRNDKGQTGSGSPSASVLTPTAVSGR